METSAGSLRSENPEFLRRSRTNPRSWRLQQDDVSTPRGPPRLVKEILSLKSISVYVPSSHKHITITSPELAKSSPHLPGAFSIYSSQAAILENPTTSSQSPSAPDRPADKSIEIALTPTDVYFDASIGFLLAMVVSKLVEAMKADPEAASAAEGSQTKPAPSIPEVKWSVEEAITCIFGEARRRCGHSRKSSWP